MIHTDVKVVNQIEVSVDNTEYASPQNKPNIEHNTTGEDKNCAAKWEVVFRGNSNNRYVQCELLAIKILTTGEIPKLATKKQVMFSKHIRMVNNVRQKYNVPLILNILLRKKKSTKLLPVCSSIPYKDNNLG